MENQAVYLTRLSKKNTEPKRYVLILDIEPMGAVRTTQKQKFADKNYKKYQTWKDTLLILWTAELLKHGFNPQTIKFSEIESITFHMTIPMGEKLSKAKIEERHSRIDQPHLQKPDIDNMLKAFMDAVMKEDSHVHTIGRTKKIWSLHGHIEVALVFDS
jgi:Holliday junction resolvase RusA-like endonuclease